MDSLRTASLCFLVATLLVPLPATAQVRQLVEVASDRFFEECRFAIENPSGYVAKARGSQQDDQIELITNDEGGLYYVHNIAPPGELVVQFRQASPGRLHMQCSVSIYIDTLVMDSAATRQALELMLEARPELRSVGGQIELRDPIAGVSTQTADMMHPVADIYNYGITGWSGRGDIAEATIQVGMYEIWTHTLLDKSISINE